MKHRKLIILALAVLAALGIAAALSGRASAQTGAQRAPCTVGSQDRSYAYGPPGSASVWFTTASHPGGCELIWVQAIPQGRHSVSFFSGKIAGTGVTATAKICFNCGISDTRLYQAFRWEQRNTPGASCYRQRFYPTLASGYSKVRCQSRKIVAHLTALVQRRRCTGDTIHWDTGTNFGVTGFHDYGEAHWTHNANRCSWFKTQILCLNNPPFGNLYTKTSSVYRGVGVNDKLACDLDDNGQRFSIDVNGTWKELCTSGGPSQCNWNHMSRKTTRVKYSLAA